VAKWEFDGSLITDPEKAAFDTQKAATCAIDADLASSESFAGR
jgi:hypothetical protein